MAQDELGRLFANLQAARKLYERLLEVAEKKQRDILRHDIEALREDLRLEEQLANEGVALELRRQALHDRCRVLLKAGAATNLQELCRAMPASWQERFAKERAALKETLERLRTVNRLNVALVNNSIEMMNGLLAALFSAEPAAAYGRDGMRAGADISGRALNTSA